MGPAAQAAGTWKFDGRLEKTHGLRFLVTRQNVQGLNRSFELSELSLLRDSSVPVIKPTPDQQPPSAVKPAETPGNTATVTAQPIDAGASLVQGASNLPGQILPLPVGTKIGTSFNTEKDKGADKLFDNDLTTWMAPTGGSARSPESGSSITLRFPEPVTNLAGIETGETDPFKNYYPEQLEFWVDSNGDGRFDTRLGSVDGLKAAKEAVARHLFQDRLEKAYGLEIRCTRQVVAGGNRVFSMNEMRLVTSDQLPLATPTPDSHRILFYSDEVPSGTTIKASFKTNDGNGVEKLLDGDPSTFMGGAQGTAREGEPASVFMRFPAPVKDLAGIKLGRSDPFNNYVWERMEIHADTTGDGTYDTLIAELTGPGAGERRFRSVVPQVHGLELRVTKQKLTGVFRVFSLNEIEGLTFRDTASTTEMRFVAEDFEDFSSWRTWATQTAQPEGERLYGGFTFLSGAYRPELAFDGAGVGIMRYIFKTDSVNPSMRAKRGKVSEQEALIDQISFHANPQGYDCSISFELIDAKGTKFRTPPTKISGEAWQAYSVDLNANTIPNFNMLRYPFKLEHLFLDSTKGGSGDVLLDNLTYVGVVDRNKRVRIRPVFEGMTYAPDKSVVVSYRMWNALGRSVTTPVEVSLYTSFDALRRSPIATKTVSVTIPAYGQQTVPVDFGILNLGHYHTRVSAAGEDFNAELEDQVAVGTLNGGRINKSPMWFGSMHPMGWISHVENEFVLKHVILPLGLDAYRVGMPEQDNRLLIDTNLLFAAGFGSMPPNLRLPNQKNENRGEPNDYQAYYDHIAKMAREEYLPYKDRIISVEFYNEPDLPGFEFLPEIDTYLKMHEVFRRAFRAEIPGVRIGTGGNTVQHGNEKKDFNRRMYTELATETDVALWHAHGSLENYTGRHRMVEHWTAQGGRPVSEALLGNSEAGEPSGESQIGRLNQAINLVKKIAWAKAQSNSLFYIWFTTTDTFDPQGGYLANENWGMITFDQRLKPSGLAYNNLIRLLANTKGMGEKTLDSRLQAMVFARDDGTTVYSVWPREQGAKLAMRFASSGQVVMTDMFGAKTPLTPERGSVVFTGNGYPFYIEVPAGVTFGEPVKPGFITYNDVIGTPPGAPTSLAYTLKNTWNKNATIELTLVGPEGKEMGRSTMQVDANQTAQGSLEFTLPVSQAFGSLGCTLRVRSQADDLVNETLPMTIMAAQMVRKAEALKPDGTDKKISGAFPIVLDTDVAVRELVSDPSTPVWAGAADLSCTTTLAHDGKGLYIRFDVRDQTHNPGAASDKLWQSDSIQAAFYAGGAHTEIGLTATDGGFGWSWIAPDASRMNQKLDAPVVVKRTGDRTVYETYLTFEQLKLDYVPMTPLRFTFLVNEDDGRGRVRIMKWFDGIASHKSADLFGFMVLE